ncbi:DUF4468 domain-containing protein [Pedobacter mendelii]|uniref:DUF4468 domain-containing protein n=1 Tax=Pedobacter mendelii TaxID=1908240 RepID=A0ABQ2BLJ8_9SPHI|nr:DUF4468 domain-containing protein [Pedobacter mendelii]GGI27251.1 hypothetical protein GCM10008119_26710 [Pedobacter mendelii]
MKYTLILLLAISSLKVAAQQKQFSLDDSGKFIYYEVVDVKTTTKDSLILRANSFLNLYKKTVIKKSSTDTSIIARGTMIIDKTILVAGHPSGEVNYNLMFEARDKKYRFWFTDFEYIPYQRDRYGNYVATTKIATPLEKTPGKLSAGEWKDVVESAYAKTTKLAENFKKILSTNLTEKSKKKTETISTKKW